MDDIRPHRKFENPKHTICKRAAKLLLLTGMSAACCMAQDHAATRRISGSIIAEDGMPVKGAVVAYAKAPRNILASGRKDMRMKSRRAPGDVDVHATTTSRADGSFDFQRPLKGQYSICASLPGGDLVSSCQWGASVVVNSFDDRDANATPIVLRKGVQLHVRVEDPSQLLPKPNPLIGASNLIIGVIAADGGFVGAPVTSTDQSGRDFRLVIPKDDSLRLWVFSRHVRIAAENGRVIGTTGEALPVGPVSATGERAIVLRVIGPAK